MNKISYDNGYGTVYSFDVVDKIPKGYEVWNIDFDNLGSGYVPLCQVYEGTYDIIKSTLKAIYIADAEERSILKEVAAWGINSRTAIAKQGRQILAKYMEA